MKYRRLVTGAAFILVFLALVTPGETAHFKCSDGDAACLVDAINQANGNGLRNTITLGPGIYALTETDNATPGGANGLPIVTGTLTIEGTTAGTTTIERDVSGPEFRIFEVAASGRLSLIHVTISGGGGASVIQGGGILVRGALSITRGIVTGNQARDGDGIESLGETRIANSTRADRA
jgi:hypothetical protein